MLWASAEEFDVGAPRPALAYGLDATPVPLFVLDRDGTVLRANAASCDLLGVGSGYATGKSLATLVEPPSRAALRSQLAASVASEEQFRIELGAANTERALLEIAVKARGRAA